LFTELGFELQAGDRVGLVGPNGVGKTTLLRILSGDDQADTGEVRLHAGARVGLLRQQPNYAPGQTLFAEARSALDVFVAAHEDMVRTAEALAAATDEAQHKALAARYDRLNEMLRHHDAYNVDHRIEQILEGLGFNDEQYQRPMETFSGGQQSRVMLAKLLLSAPDVMLLDEPSNHLDIGATRWLEDYLVKQPEAMLIVSHDRYFLNRVVNRIFELNSGQINSYPGNYDAYVRQRQEHYERQLKTYEAQAEYIAKQEDYIRRVHYGQLHKQAASRQKQLDKIERVERPTMVEVPRMHFPEVTRSGDIVLQVDDLAKTYDRPLFKDLSFQLQRGRRLGIMGPNGCGKTTLLKILLGQEQQTSGMVKRGQLVQLGYYDQHLKTLDESKPVIRAIWPEGDPEATEQRMRNLLGRFGLTGEIVYQEVGALSGGERSRAALARLAALEVSVLVLDEPTNHLDLWACEALEESLQQFEGTAIVVSHDRYFLNRVVDLLIVFEEGRCQVVHGNYDMYERLRVEQRANAAPAKAEAPTRNEVQKTSTAKVKKKRKYAYRKVEDLEAEIATTETRLKELEELLASPDLYRDGDKVKETMRAFEETKVQLKQLYEHWEEAVELN
jgi:ATP-binding cassette subfamily F protein 3